MQRSNCIIARDTLPYSFPMFQIIYVNLIRAFACHFMRDPAHALRYAPQIIFTQWGGWMNQTRKVCYLANNTTNYDRTILPSVMLYHIVTLLFFGSLGAFDACFVHLLHCLANRTFCHTRITKIGSLAIDKGGQSSWTKAVPSQKAKDTFWFCMLSGYDL